MANSPSNRILAQTIFTFNSANLDNTLKYAATLDFPTRLLRIINESNENVIISYDGVNAHDVVLADTTIQLPFGALGFSNNNSCAMAANTNIYVTGSAGMGNIIFVAYYQPSNNP